MLFLWQIKNRIKLKKLRTLEGYIDFIRNTDLSKCLPLEIGNEADLKEADYENLFSYLDEYDILKEKYSLNEVIKGENDFERALSIMQWLTDSTYYSGYQLSFYKFLPDDSVSILDFSYKKPFKFAINCRYKAIVLTDLLISLGFKAYPVAMLDSDKNACHLTVHVYLNDEQKLIMLDPSFNTYFTDDSGKLLNAFELRSLFLNENEPIINGYNFNGTIECIQIYKEFFIKSCLTNLSTWHDNSKLGRQNTKGFKGKKMFDCKLPLFEQSKRGE